MSRPTIVEGVHHGLWKGARPNVKFLKLRFGIVEEEKRKIRRVTRKGMDKSRAGVTMSSKA